MFRNIACQLLVDHIYVIDVIKNKELNFCWKMLKTSTAVFSFLVSSEK